MLERALRINFNVIARVHNAQVAVPNKDYAKKRKYKLTFKLHSFAETRSRAPAGRKRQKRSGFSQYVRLGGVRGNKYKVN